MDKWRKVQIIDRMTQRSTQTAQPSQATRFSLTFPGSPPHPKSAPPSPRSPVPPIRVDGAALALRAAFGCLSHFVRLRVFSVLIRFAHPPGSFQSSVCLRLSPLRSGSLRSAPWSIHSGGISPLSRPPPERTDSSHLISSLRRSNFASRLRSCGAKIRQCAPLKITFCDEVRLIRAGRVIRG